jgi:ferrochelatase
MKYNKTAILLINIGTPDNPSIKAVGRFLFQFLNDKYIIDLPFLLRKFLVNCIIIPFRTPKLAKLYQQLWDESGSPLLYHTQSLTKKLQSNLPENYEIFMAMRYGNPSIKNAVKEIKRKGIFNNILLLPLYPQYATSTTLTSIIEVKRKLKKYKLDIELAIVDQFFNNKVFIQSIIHNAAKYDLNSYDHIIFSYHGLPINQVENTHPDHTCNDLNCSTHFDENNEKCYHAACYATTRLLVEKLKLRKDQYTTSFQSRLLKNWLAPFSNEIIIQKAKEGKKRILVFSPAFVADCLETTIEIAYEYDLLFKKNGGEFLQLVESLNDSEEWVKCLKEIVILSDHEVSV